MRICNRSRRGGLLVLILLGGPLAEAQGLARTLPRGVPAAEALATWERSDGEAEEPDAVVVYALYVNPLRPSLYEMTRFRVDRLERRPGRKTRRARDTEKLLWNARPGTREPLVCYERAGRRSWRTLWLPKWTWRQIAPGTTEYRAAMFTAIRVYNLHRARLGLPPPG